MKQFINYLKDIYSDTIINSILDVAINGKYEIYFLNRLTGVPQALTMVQLMGIRKFRGVNILLETGQTYQIGLVTSQMTKGTYQEVYFDNLMVDDNTLVQIKHEFGNGDSNSHQS